MESVFLKVVDLSTAASCIVVAILFLRLLLRKAPKYLSCTLWILVAVRLAFPFTIESVFSMQPDVEDIYSDVNSAVNVVMRPYQSPVDIAGEVGEALSGVNKSGLESSITVIQPGSSDVMTEQYADNSAKTPLDWRSILPVIWIIGVGLGVGFAIVSVVSLQLKLSASTLLEKGIRQSDAIDSPFVMGVFKPTIYLPYSLKQGREFAIAHERAHISRGDHLWKPLGFMFLTVYWFNPFVWVAYILLCRDIEVACDEKVISQYTREERQAYSLALLNCSCGHRTLAAHPVEFCEIGIKPRIKKIMGYKKPGFWIRTVTLLSGIIIAVTFLTSPSAVAKDGTFFDSISNVNDTANYDVPPLGLTVETMSMDTVTVKLSLKGDFDGARIFTNGPVQVKRLVDGQWEPVDRAFIYADAWLMSYTEFPNLSELTGINVKLNLPEKFEIGQTYQISIPMTTDRDPSKGKEYVISTEFVFVPSVALPEAGKKPVALENLPSNYSAEEAVAEGGFRIMNDAVTIYDGQLEKEGIDHFNGFLLSVFRGIPCEMRVASSYGSFQDGSYKVRFGDIVFDGHRYTVRTLMDRDSGTIVSQDYKYLIRFVGPSETPDMEYDYYERYVLTNSTEVTWEDIYTGKYTECFVLFSYLTRDINNLELNKDVTKITLEYRGEIVGEIFNKNTCDLICEIISKAKAHSDEAPCSCADYAVDFDLEMVLWFQDGGKISVNPIRGREVFVMGEDHYEYTDFYQNVPYDKQDGYMMHILLECFGLDKWPQ